MRISDWSSDVCSSDAIDCNCSMCRRRGGLLAFFPREALTLTTPESNYGTYRFNKEHLAHQFCPTCGVAPFSEGADPRTGAKMVAVNVRCLPDLRSAAPPFELQSISRISTKVF